MIPISVKELQSGHWRFAEFSQSSKISVWFISSSNFSDSSLNLLLEVTGIDKDSSDSSNIETFSSVLHLLPELIPIFLLTSAEH